MIRPIADIDFPAPGRHDFQPMDRNRHPTLITVGLLFALAMAMFGNVLFLCWKKTLPG